MAELSFAAFDHMDSAGRSPVELFRERLRIVETYEQAGFASYYVAEHHSTPLGFAPSPAVYLAAVAERTRRMRFGPMVFLLPLYNPLRLADEVTMLDQMSDGRLDVGVGTGISPAELATFGVDKAETPAMFDEALAVLKLAWTHDRVSYAGTYYRFDDVPITSHPVQKPYPPLYYGVGHPEAIPARLAAGFHAITLAGRAQARGLWTTPEAVRALAGDDRRRLGVYRYVIVHRDSAHAWTIARRAYRRWEQSFHYLWRLRGITPVFGMRPTELDGMVEAGVAIVGNPDEVVAGVLDHLQESGSNTLVGQFVFGDMTEAEGRASIELFASDVMPRVREAWESLTAASR